MFNGIKGAFTYWKNAFKYVTTSDDSYFYTDEDNTMRVNINEINDKFALSDKSGQVIWTYARKRDAVRGAARRGFTVV